MCVFFKFLPIKLHGMIAINAHSQSAPDGHEQINDIVFIASQCVIGLNTNLLHQNAM